MSLAAIRKVRQQGFKPGVVNMVIGPAPRWLDDDESVVKIAADSRPERMDFRPLVGVPVAVFQTQPLPDVTLRAIDAANAAGATFVGFADDSGTYPALTNETERVALSLRRTWEQLCQS